MKRKNIVVLISVIAAVVAAVIAVIVFRDRIAAFIQSVSAKRNRIPSDPEPGPDFTDEEREAFADI